MTYSNQGETFFSIVIPSYNSSKIIKRAIESITSQDFDNYEIIVVDDASRDNSREVLEQISASNDKVITHFKEKNNGTLSSRAKGVCLARGKYIMLLDQDDELAAGTLEKLALELEKAPVDILHFGTEVIPENDLAKDAKKDTEAWMNPEAKVLSDDEILSKQFAFDDGFDWNVHHKVYEAQLAKKAWAIYKEECLCYSDDLLVSFILAAFAKSYRAIPDSKWYLYHLGAGETLSGDYSFESFERVNGLDLKAFNLVRDFANSRNCPEVTNIDGSLKDCEARLVSHVMNEIRDHIESHLFSKCLKQAADDWNHVLVATALWRFVRDQAYGDFVKQAGDLKSDKYLRLLFKNALILNDQLRADEDDAYLIEMRNKAIQHLRDVKSLRDDFNLSSDIEDKIREIVNQDNQQNLSLQNQNSKSDVRIFVSCHKEVDTYKSDILTPVQVGAEKAKSKYPWAYQDDSGENISNLNPMYCELTAQYWAWKNMDCDWYGFCHYRRYFNFSTHTFDENPFGEVIDGFIDEDSQKRYCLTDEQITEAIKDYDIITTKFQDLKDFPGDFHTPIEHWRAAPSLYDRDLELLGEIVAQKYPEYSETYKSYMNNSKTCFGNMFIMKKDIFFQYCEWLFDILSEFENRYKPKNYSRESLRTVGHLAERLLNVFVLKYKDDNPNIKHKELQCVHFERPDKLQIPKYSLESSADTKQTIPIVLAADDFYVPILTTAIYSTIENASQDYNYDVIVFHSNISSENQLIMKKFFAQYEHVSLRFLEVERLISKCKLTTSNEHISNETYYRFLIQSLLPQYDKVVYLDSDLVVEGDISEIFNVDIEDKYIAAIKDIDFLGNLNYKDGQRLKYNENVLLMDDPYDYFQAGVLVMNTKKLRNLHKTDTWMLLASDSSFIYNDQDILNSQCEHGVEFLPSEWNVMHDCGHRVTNVFSFAPAEIFTEYQKARQNPKVIHFAGYQKPWKYENVDMEEYFWKYARHTPFIQKIIERRIIWVEKWKIQDALDNRFERHQRLYHPLMTLPAKTARKMKGNN